ncbi:SEC14-like protein 3, partial [Asbolus verrucosus]
FRRTVSDIIQPHHDDIFLLRWLRARSWDAEAAEKMLRQSMKWRQQWEVDGALKSWQPPEVIDLYYPSGTTGRDQEGLPVIVVPFAGFDVVGFLHSVSKQDIIKTTIQILEKNMGMAAEKDLHQVVVVMDMDGFNIKQYAWRPATELVISLIQMYEANYPEILKACYIINAPRVFAIAFNVIKKFMNEYTIGKIQIFKNDPKKWKKVLLDNIGPDSLPQYFGGNLIDPDGNPRYTTEVKQGGKIPKHLYKQSFEQNPETENMKQFTTVVIKKSDKLILDFSVAEDGCFLKWDFRTENHDIRFGVTLKDADGKTTPVVRHKRVAAHQIDENVVTFDNSYSLLRSKKLHYNVSLTPPLEKLNILPAQEEIIDDATDTLAAASLAL